MFDLRWTGEPSELRSISASLRTVKSFNAGEPINVIPPPKRHPYDQWAPDARALDVVGDKWTLLIVRDLAAGPRRFVALQRVLPGISTEQLRSRLNRMVADGLLTRRRYREVPPRVDYELTERARDLVPVLAALARWGYEWAWSEPRRVEEIDVGAIFRLAPGLVRPARELRGTAALTVNGRSKGAARRTYLFTASEGRLSLSERAEAGEADAHATGAERDWVAALGPAASRAGLEVRGHRALIDAVLDGLSPVSARVSAVA
jgi:DNA-binding HxlR family transcriptional regulator